MSDIVKREPVEMAGVKKSMSYEGEGVRGREEGRGRCGSHVVERDMRECGLKREDAQERDKWRKLLWEATSQTPCVSGEDGHKTIVVVVLTLSHSEPLLKSQIVWC